MKKTLITLCILTSEIVFPQWNSNVTINTSVCSAAKSQSNVHAVTDAGNGIIMAWDDNRNSPGGSTDIFAQRLNSNGFPIWTTKGIAICSHTSTQRSTAIVETGNGTAIIAWEDFRNGIYDIFAQKVDSSGNILWTSNGVAICTGTKIRRIQSW